MGSSNALTEFQEAWLEAHAKDSVADKVKAKWELHKKRAPKKEANYRKILELERQIAKEEEADDAAFGKACAEDIPEYWFEIIKTVPDLSSHIDEDTDPKALKALTNITCTVLSAAECAKRGWLEGFGITWTFADNPIVQAGSYTKLFGYVRDEESVLRRVSCEETVGANIKWKGQNLIEVAKKEDSTNVWLWLGTSITDADAKKLSERMKDADDDMDDVNIFSADLEGHFEIGECFKEEILPNHIHFYTGEGVVELAEIDDDDSIPSDGDDDDEED